MRDIFNSSTIKQLSGREVAGMVMHSMVETLFSQPQTFPESELDRVVSAAWRNPGSSYPYWCRIMFMAEFLQSEIQIGALENKGFLDLVIMELTLKFIEDRDFGDHESSPNCPSCKADAQNRAANYKRDYLIKSVKIVSNIEKNLQQHGKMLALLHTIGDVIGCNKIMERVARASDMLEETIKLYNLCAKAANFQIEYHYPDKKKQEGILLLLLSIEGYRPPTTFSDRARELLLSNKGSEVLSLIGDGGNYA